MTDLKLWKKKQRIDDSVKMFIIVLGYGDIAKALLYRGWVKNPNSVSPCFDFKFRNRLQQFIRILDCESLSQVYMFNHQSWIISIIDTHSTQGHLIDRTRRISKIQEKNLSYQKLNQFQKCIFIY